MGTKLKRTWMKKNTFTMYDREFYDSKAYQKLTLSARNLFEFLLRERKYKGKGKDKIWLNNGEISFNRIEFKELYGYTNETCQKARNLLIEVGLIKIERVGGQGRGDMNEYSILYKCYPKTERWKECPQKNWEHEIPNHKGKTLGKKWVKGESGNPKYQKSKNQSTKVTPKQPKASTKVDPTGSKTIYSDRHLNGVKKTVSDK